jgi:hypothetical protein
MGLSKSRRIRIADQQIGSGGLNPSLAYALKYLAAQKTSTHAVGLAVRQAVQLRVWLEDMQKQLQKTATALRDHPASILSTFQKILSRPSYFLVPSTTGDWIILLGPDVKRSSFALAAKAVATATAPMEVVPAHGRVFDFVLPQPSLPARAFAFFWGTTRMVHHWLMHPLVDTREPS